MNATETSQVVLHPDETLDDLVERRIIELLEKEGEPLVPKRLRIKLLLGTALHPFGVHTWVRHKRYEADRLIDVGVVCAYCSKGKRA